MEAETKTFSMLYYVALDATDASVHVPQNSVKKVIELLSRSREVSPKNGRNSQSRETDAGKKIAATNTLVQCTHCLGMNYYVNFLGGIGSNGFHIK